MTAPSIKWPSILPAPTVEYSLDIAHSSARTEMESGHIRQRRRFSDSNQSISVSWSFTDLEFQLFESFATHKLDGGNGWFETDILSGGGVVRHKVRIQNGQYSASYQNFMHWTVSATLDVEEVNRLAPEILDILLAYETDLKGMAPVLSALEQTTNFNQLGTTT